jgi:hypothetical protein
MNDHAFARVIRPLRLHSIRLEKAARKLKGKKHDFAKTREAIPLRSRRTLICSTKQREMGVDQEMGGANPRYEMETSHGAGCDHDAQTIRP